MKFFLIAFAVIAAVAADVSHLPNSEYLPPVQEAAPVAVPINEYLPPVQQQVSQVVEAAPAHELAEDGYRYQTQRRVVYRRQRRDVSHLPSNEYLPPAEEAEPVEVAPIQEVSNAVVEEAAPAHELAEDGYRYQTRRRLVYRRQRRDVSHLPSNEYLPPAEESAPVVDAPVQEVAVVEEAAPAHELAQDGYRYQTRRRLVYRRQRRDVSHLASNEYLPPAEESAPVVKEPAAVNVQEVAEVEVAPVQEVSNVVVEEAAPAHELTENGYRYKTHRRVVYRRQRRDVSHLPSNEYLPPVQESAPVSAPTNEYLPPVQQQVSSQAVEAAPAHELSENGYRYKTQRRLVFRRRH